jgi:hypothetical protein
MAIRVGPAIFENHVSIEVIPGKWTDTFIFPVRHDMALPPWSYAEVVKKVIRPLRKLRRGASLWVPVLTPGKWYFEETKYALRKASIAVAVTQDLELPRILDFSSPPGIYDVPCQGGEPDDPLVAVDLKKNALRCLLKMACFTAAFSSEIACSLMIAEGTSRRALKTLVARGYVEYHPNDGNMDSHLVEAKASRTGGSRRKSTMWNGDHFPYWKIKRQGVSAALRAWGVPIGTGFDQRLEKNRLLNSLHRRRSRQWPQWVRLGLPHATIYTGWNEVSIPGIRARPDALAWGKIHGVETLFWLEVESGSVASWCIEERTSIRWERATNYAQAAGVHLVFVLLGQPWVQEAARRAFKDVPPTCAAIVSSWNRLDFGRLPFPKWGEVVLSSITRSTRR